MKLSIAIIAYNEARHIAAALQSAAGLSDDLLVLDAQSSDETAAIAAANGARVVVEPWRGFPAQRNRALALCKHEWVFFLDADERITDELRAELQQLVAAPMIFQGWRVPRYNQFFGRTLRGGGWYPDEQLRLLRRDHARYDETRLVHELVILDGPTGVLRGHLLHINIETLGEFMRKQSRYAAAEARTMWMAGRRMRIRNLVGAPARVFFWRYVQLAGWRDGWLGLFLCSALAACEALAFLMLWSLQRRQN